MKKRIRYKVVDKNRRSCVVPTGSKYCLYYPKGAIVKAIPGSLGIMVFRTRRQAQSLAYCNRGILKVRVIGRKLKIVRFSGYNSDPLSNTLMFKKFYKFIQFRKNWWHTHKVRTMHIPEGTECYPAVEVLE